MLRRQLLSAALAQVNSIGLPSPSANTQTSAQHIDSPDKIEFVESETVYSPLPTTTFTSVWAKPSFRGVEPGSPTDSSQDKPHERCSSPAAQSDRFTPEYTDDDSASSSAQSDRFTPEYTDDDSTETMMVREDSVARSSSSPVFASEGVDLDLVNNQRDSLEISGPGSARRDKERDDTPMSDDDFNMGISDDELAIVLDSHESATQKYKADEPQNNVTATNHQNPVLNNTEAEYVQLIEQHIAALRQDVDEKLSAHKTELHTRDAETRFRAQLDALALLLHWSNALSSGLGGRAELKAFLHHAVERVCFLYQVPDSLLFGRRQDDDDLAAAAADELEDLAQEVNLFHDPMKPSELSAADFPDFSKRQRVLSSLLKHVVAVGKAHENGDCQDIEIRAAAGYLAGLISLKIQDGQEDSAKSLVAKMEQVLARPDVQADTKTKLARQVFFWNRRINAKADAVDAWRSTIGMGAENIKPISQSWQQEDEIEREREKKLSHHPENEPPKDANSKVEMTDVFTTIASGKRKHDAIDTLDEVTAPSSSTRAESELVTPPATPVAKKHKNDDTSSTLSVTTRLGTVVSRSVAALTFGLVGWLAANEKC
ncbi:hypothetical protein HDU87_000188 [Geranomyces variabilis]|uniref:Uncharacterized protein n=1 Tax=Geranomyces variabilis TaxID=109894 RepID=A0AAD5TRU5_9FUNG|nr:hypothetical protein HDU87_000188 [Geranomyces variabilis]